MSAGKTSLRVFGAAGAALALLLLAGCGGATPDVRFNQAVFTASPQANANSATPVDLVIVYDQTLTDELLKLSASDWFAHKDQFLRDHPAGVAVSSWELVPGQKITAPLKQKDAAWTAFVFANYATPGPHRIRLDKGGTLSIGLGDDDVSLSSNATGP